MTTISLTVNGRAVEREVEPRTHLADFLRDELRLTGTHLACEHGVCGACTVLVQEQPIRACIAYAVACDGLAVRTIEGFEADPLMQRLREAFSREHALQCGFCTPGMLIAARDIVQRLPGADEARIRAELAGNLCRCTGYLGIVRAVASVLAEGGPVGAPAPAPATVAAPAPFTAAAPAAAASAESAAPTEAPRPGWSHLEESFRIAAAPDAVWRALADFPGVAACLPGAELDEHDARGVKGRLKLRLGPIAASFAGSATVQRDDAALAALVKGAGSDTLSRSRTRGELRYRLSAEAGGTATRVLLAVDYDLQGPLAQFGRSELAHEVARRIVATFAANLDARLTAPAGGAPPASAAPPLKPAALLWQVLWDRLRALFRRR